MSKEGLVQCYNRGCGEQFDPNNNPDGACCYHPGLPFFHDAYKGWSCCNRKFTDFTEFLNTKGCSYSKHSNIMPPEPEKPKLTMDIDKEVIEVKPMVHIDLPRPPIDTPMVTIKPEIASSLKVIESNIITETNKKATNGDIAIGTVCNNSGCTSTYKGNQSNEEQCVYHSGSPIFHEGMKYWSCCQKKTTDFNSFLSQAGCQIGKHLWKKEETNDQLVKCRWDWHQTASHVIVSVYAKQYCPTSSLVQLNPIRVFANLVFPQLLYGTFTLDIELKGVIDVKASQVSMYGTKVEIKLKKAEPGTWSELDIPKPIIEKESSKVDQLMPRIEAVDLNDI